MSIDTYFKKLRVQFRKNGVEISEDVFTRYHPATMDVGNKICVFCKSTIDITKEHVIPKWLIGKQFNGRMISSVNRQSQSYNKAVISACADCNNNTLSEIEKYIIYTVKRMQDEQPSVEEICNIIRWLEILDYKLQVYDCGRKYIKYGESEYDLVWGMLPVSMMRHFPEPNPFKAQEYIRRAQKRIAIKSKMKRMPSLVAFRTAEPHFNFFSQPDEYIYLSFPQQNIALFYFLRKEFYDLKTPYEEALYYIDAVTKT